MSSSNKRSSPNSFSYNTLFKSVDQEQPQYLPGKKVVNNKYLNSSHNFTSSATYTTPDSNPTVSTMENLYINPFNYGDDSGYDMEEMSMPLNMNSDDYQPQVSQFLPTNHISIGPSGPIFLDNQNLNMDLPSSCYAPTLENCHSVSYSRGPLPGSPCGLLSKMDIKQTQTNNFTVQLSNIDFLDPMNSNDLSPLPADINIDLQQYDMALNLQKTHDHDAQKVTMKLPLDTYTEINSKNIESPLKSKRSSYDAFSPDTAPNTPSSTPNIKRHKSIQLTEELVEEINEADRRRRNLVASAKFRYKKKQREQKMEQESKGLTDKIDNMKTQINRLEMENKYLRKLVLDASTLKNQDSIRNIRKQIINKMNSSLQTGEQKYQTLY